MLLLEPNQVPAVCPPRSILLCLQCWQLLYALGIGEFIPNRLTAPLAGILCSSWPASDVCAAAVSLIFFGPSQFITPDDYVAISRTWPSSVASRNLVHWAQVCLQHALLKCLCYLSNIIAFDRGWLFCLLCCLLELHLMMVISLLITHYHTRIVHCYQYR
jgi:hypothetical protein